MKKRIAILLFLFTLTCLGKRDPFAPPRGIVKSYCRYMGNADCDGQQYAFIEWKKELEIVNIGHLFDGVWRVCLITVDYIELEHTSDGYKQKIEKNKE